MDSETKDATFRDLALMLETQLETVIANQHLLLSMHETLKHLVPKYETEVLAALANPQQSKKQQPDPNQLWTTQAKKTLLKLRG